MRSKSTARQARSLTPTTVAVGLPALLANAVAVTLSAVWLWRQLAGANVLIAWIEFATLAMLMPIFSAIVFCASNARASGRRSLGIAAFAVAGVYVGALINSDSFASRLFHAPIISIGHINVFFVASALAWSGMLFAGYPGASLPRIDRRIALFGLLSMVLLALVALPANETALSLFAGLVWGVFGTDDAVSLVLLGLYLVQLNNASQSPLESLLLTALLSAFLLGLRGDELAAAGIVLFIPIAVLEIVSAIARPKVSLLDSSSVTQLSVRMGAIVAWLLVIGGYARLVEALALLVVGTTCVRVLLPTEKRRLSTLREQTFAVGDIALATLAGAAIQLVSGAVGLQAALADALVGLPAAVLVTTFLALSAVSTTVVRPVTALLLMAPLATPLLQSVGLSLPQTILVSALSVWTMRGLVRREVLPLGFVLARLSGLLVMIMVLYWSKVADGLLNHMRFW
ncbi:MAG: hypothetical protein AAGC71_15170 [Pseudomonadota bacterium]